MKRSTLVVTVAVALTKKPVADLPTAVEEWLDGNKWAGDLFDQNDWDFRRFVLDVQKVYETHKGKR